MEQTPSAVPATAPQGGEIRAHWAWVEPTVWTERMLTTLETGIEGGKWFRLIDKVWSPKNLGSSLEKGSSQRRTLKDRFHYMEQCSLNDSISKGCRMLRSRPRT